MSPKFLKIKNKILNADVFKVLFSNAGLSLISLIASIVYARILGLEDYGTYVVIFFSTVTIALIFGIRSSEIYIRYIDTLVCKNRESIALCFSTIVEFIFVLICVLFYYLFWILFPPIKDINWLYVVIMSLYLSELNKRKTR